MSHPTPEERQVITDMAADIARAMVTAVAPEIIKLIATTRTNARVTAMGDLLSVEPLTLGTLEAFEPIPVRDYAKEAWIAAYVAALPLSDLQHPFGPDVIAQQALAAFKEAFPS